MPLLDMAAAPPTWPTQGGAPDAAWILLVIAAAFMVGIAGTFAVILLRESRRKGGKP